VEGIVMFKKFIISRSGSPYINLVKLAKLHDGPQKFINAVHHAGQVQGIIKVLVVEAGGLAVGVIAWGVKELPWWKRNAKNEKHGENIITNSYVDCPECGIRFEQSSRPSLGCPNCNCGITDQEFEDVICGDEL
jgi:hypothetical protein